MNAPSSPYTIAFPIRTSMSYRWYLSMATAIEPSSNTSEALKIRPVVVVSARIATQNATATTAAALTNHFSWRRSSPTERRNRAMSETADAKTASTSATTDTVTRTTATVATPPFETASSKLMNGRSQLAVANTSMLAGARTKIPAHTHASGRQRADGRRPVGNNRNSHGNRQIAIGSIQVPSHATARPAGSEFGSATREWIAYERAKLEIARAAPATSSSQPIGFSRRRDAMTMPKIGTQMFAATSNTPPTLQASDTRGSVVDRSMNRKASPPIMNAIDARPTDQATLRALRTVTAPPRWILTPGRRPCTGALRPAPRWSVGRYLTASCCSATLRGRVEPPVLTVAPLTSPGVTP